MAPIFNIDGVNYAYMKKGGLYLVGKNLEIKYLD